MWRDVEVGDVVRGLVWGDVDPGGGLGTCEADGGAIVG